MAKPKPVKIDTAPTSIKVLRTRWKSITGVVQQPLREVERWVDFAVELSNLPEAEREAFMSEVKNWKHRWRLIHYPVWRLELAAAQPRTLFNADNLIEDWIDKQRSLQHVTDVPPPARGRPRKVRTVPNAVLEAIALLATHVVDFNLDLRNVQTQLADGVKVVRAQRGQS
ncbi:MAG: hypothetical protein RI928_1681 [Pseudomonadota bacterium]|jgi:hypothetical protein